MRHDTARARSLTDGIIRPGDRDHYISGFNCWIGVFTFVFGIFIDELDAVSPVNVRGRTKAIIENIADGSIQDFEMLLRNVS